MENWINVNDKPIPIDDVVWLATKYGRACIGYLRSELSDCAATYNKRMESVMMPLEFISHWKPFIWAEKK